MNKTIREIWVCSNCGKILKNDKMNDKEYLEWVEGFRAYSCNCFLSESDVRKINTIQRPAIKLEEFRDKILPFPVSGIVKPNILIRIITSKGKLETKSNKRGEFTLDLANLEGDYRKLKVFKIKIENKIKEFKIDKNKGFMEYEKREIKDLEGFI